MSPVPTLQPVSSPARPPVQGSLHELPFTPMMVSERAHAYIRNIPTFRRIMPESSDTVSCAPKPRIQNRIKPIMAHIFWYTIQGQHRLAKDCGLSQATISRLVRGEIEPSHQVAATVTKALQSRLEMPLSMREVFSTDGTYPTPRVCDLTGFCGGCFPYEALQDDGTMKPEYRGLLRGDWCTYPPMTQLDEPSISFL